MRGVPPSVATTAGVFEKLCYDNKDRVSAGIIVAGWDKEVGPSVYNIPLGGGLFRQPWAIGGASRCIAWSRTFSDRGMFGARFRVNVRIWLLRRYLSRRMGQR